MARKSYDGLIRDIANAINKDFHWVERQFIEMIDFNSNRDELFAELKSQKETITKLENRINQLELHSHSMPGWNGGSSWE